VSCTVLKEQMWSILWTHLLLMESYLYYSVLVF